MGLRIIDRKILDIGRPATQADVDHIRGIILNRQIPVTKVIGFTLDVHGQSTSNYMMERRSTTLEALHQVSLNLKYLTFLKTGNTTINGELPEGLITAETLMSCLKSKNAPPRILEKKRVIMTLRNKASFTLHVLHKCGSHDIKDSARKTRNLRNAYVCQPDFSLASHILIAPVLRPDGNIGCTVAAGISEEFLTVLLNEQEELLLNAESSLEEGVW